MAIKISTNGSVSECVVPLRKYTGLAITDINNKIENIDFFAETDANDIDDMENLKGLVDNLMKLGAEEKYLTVMNMEKEFSIIKKFLTTNLIIILTD